MFIKKINIQNFTVFESIEIDFCSGVNILIGENGTGKTHIKKNMYAPLSLQYLQGRVPFWEDLFTTDIDEDSIPHFKRNASKDFEIKIYFDSVKEFININGTFSFTKCNTSSVFIPATEMLSHSKGLLALDRERRIPFDKTLIDIVAKAQMGEAKQISPASEKIIDILSQTIDGKVVYSNDTFYIVKKNGLKVEFSMEAEGLRKLGILWKIIRNGLLNEEAILFWDEPEANINPQLIPKVVEVLLELQRSGVQIFIATHDYNLAKYFEVYRKSEDKVLYHSLFKTDNGVKAKVALRYQDIYNNPIEKANEILYNHILDKAAEEVEDERM